MRLHLLTALASLGLATVAVGANQVLVVGTGGYSTLQAAIDAATDGDVLLVKVGAFTAATIVDKALTIVTDDPADTGIFRIRNLTIRELSAAKTVVVRGVEFTEYGWSPTPRVDILDCAGTVVLEDCQMNHAEPAAVRATNSSSVFLVRCVAEGRVGVAMQGKAAQPALVATDSEVFAYDSVLEGGAGANDFDPQVQLYPGVATHGGIGAVIDGGMLFTSGTIVSGGDGGDILSGFGYVGSGPFYAGTGGFGISLGPDAIWRRLQSPLIPGAAGKSLLPAPYHDGEPGAPLLDLGGTQWMIPEFARKLELSSPVREGEAQGITVHGQPGEPAWLLLAPDTSGFYLGGVRGALLPALPFTLVPLGNLDAEGGLAFSLTLKGNLLPPGFDAIVVHLQAMFAGSNAPILLSSPSSTILLDAAF